MSQKCPICNARATIRATLPDEHAAFEAPSKDLLVDLKRADASTDVLAGHPATVHGDFEEAKVPGAVEPAGDPRRNRPTDQRRDQ